MRYLFLDNFRGFSKASIPLVDVNFLVGENSTGKTSLLTMLRMFSSPGLFMGAEFQGEDIKLGLFSEMVSAHSKDQTYFRLGVIQDRPAHKKGLLTVSGLLFTYKEERGLPQISRLTCSFGNRELSLKFDGDRVFFKKEAARHYANAKEMNDCIPTWIAAHSGDGKDWIELILPEGFKKGQFPVFVVLTLAAASTDPKESLPFSFFTPQFGPQVVWIAPIRTAARRSYDEPHTVFSSEGLHTLRMSSGEC